MLCFFVTSYRKYRRHPHHIRSRDRLLTYPFVSNLPLRATWFRCPVATAKATLRVSGSYDHILEVASVLTRPVTSLDSKFLCYIIRRFGSLGGQSRSSLAAGIAASLLLKISLFVRSLSTSKLINLLRVHCYILSPHQLMFVIYCHRTIINLHIMPPRSCVWKTWISILKCPARAWTSIRLEPAARSTPAYLTSNILLGIQHIFQEAVYEFNI